MIHQSHHKYTQSITLHRTPNCVRALKAPSSREEPIRGIRYHEAPATQSGFLEGPTSHNIHISDGHNSEDRVFQSNNEGCFEGPYVGCSRSTVAWGSFEAPSVGGPPKNRIWSCIWDNVSDTIRSFRAPFVLRVYLPIIMINFAAYNIS